MRDAIISRSWPARSFDLTPLDHFLCGYLKLLIFRNKPDILQAFQFNIECAVDDIRLELVKNVLENWVHRIHSYRSGRGGHFI